MSFKNYRRSIILDFDYEEVKKGVPAVSKQLALLNAETRKQREELKLSGTAVDKLNISYQEYSNKVKIYSDRVNNLRDELNNLTSAENQNSKSITNKTIDLKNAETQLARYRNSLEIVNEELEKQEELMNQELNKRENFFTKAADKVEEFNKKATEAGTSLKEIGQGLTDTGKILTAAITVPLVTIGTLSVKTAMEFESAFAGVRKTVEATEEEFAILEKGILDMTKIIPASAVEIAGVAEAAGQLGIQKDNILGFTLTMINLGETTNMSAEQAATALARLANITQMSHNNFDRLGSTIVALGNSLATTESEIVNMALRLAGAGKQVGMTEAEILSFAGALSSVGIEAEAGGSAFSKLMVNIQLATEKGGNDLRNFARVAGMSVGEFKRVFKEDASSAIIAFIEGLGNMQNQGRSAIKVLDDMGITEVRLRDALLRAAGAGDLFNESLSIGSKAWEENTALTKEAAERYATFESELQIFLNTLKLIGMDLGKSVLPVLSLMLMLSQPLVEIIGLIASGINALPGPIRNVVVVILMLMAALGPVLIIMGKIISTVSDFSKITNIAGVSTSAFGLKLMKIIGIVMVAATVITLLVTAINALTGKQNAFIAQVEAMSNLKVSAPEVPNVKIPSYATHGSHRSGLDRVPFDGYKAELHKDEEILTADDPRNQNNWRKGNNPYNNNSFGQSQDERYERLLERFDRLITATEKMQQSYEDNRRFNRMGEVGV